MSNYSYYNWGFTYYTGGAYYSTYYSPVSVTTSANSNIAYNGSARLSITARCNYPNAKINKINIQSSTSALGLMTGSTSRNVTAYVNSNNVSVTLYNRNTSTNQVNANLLISAYTPNGAYKQTSRVITLAGVPKAEPNNSYYSYYATYFTYFNAANKNLYTYYYNINSVSLSLSGSSQLSYNASATIIPRVSLSHSAAKVSHIIYRIYSPYAVSLSKSSLLTQGRTSGAANIYAYNTSSSTQTTRVDVTVYCGNVYRTASQSFTVQPKPSEVKPQILNHALTVPAYIDWNAKGDVIAYVAVNNDNVTNCATRIISGDSNVAYFQYNGISSSAMAALGNSIKALTVGEVRTNPDYSHSGRTIKLENTITTKAGLKSTAYATCYIQPTNMSYYNTYYGPVIKSAAISKSASSVAYNGECEMRLTYNILRDTIKSVTWSTTSPYANISSSGAFATVFGANTTALTQSATIKATLTTTKGLQYTCATTLKIEAMPEPEVPDTPETPEVPVVTVDEVRENIISYINSQFSMLSK